MEVENELKAIRYLLNDLILYTYNLHQKLDSIVPTKREYKVTEPNINGDSIAFDLFTIPKNKYNDLIERYTIDIVNDACVKLDEFIKIHEYIPYKRPYDSLNRRFIKEVLFDREQRRTNGNK